MKFCDVEKIQNRQSQFNFTGHKKVIELLIDNGANLNIVNSKHDTALIVALYGGNNS